MVKGTDFRSRVEVGSNKSIKLAGNVEIRVGLLVPLQLEREDSGIDSEDAACVPGMRFPEANNFVDSSSSDDEFIMDAIRDERNNAVRIFFNLTLTILRFLTANQFNKTTTPVLPSQDLKKHIQDAWMDFVGMDYPMVPLVRREIAVDSQSVDRSSPDRSSPLYEVELTASDEDDDTSNVEVVIPINNQQRKKALEAEWARGVGGPPAESVAPRAPEGLHVSQLPPRDLCNHPHGESAASAPLPPPDRPLGRPTRAYLPLPRQPLSPPRLISTDNSRRKHRRPALCNNRQLRRDIIDAVSTGACSVRIRGLLHYMACECVI
ncbi:hypothetical protein RR46_07720 [Papilio xuthus]|uniref:Uncharacterized protein n=1 Tax=Papilio xuthus TaxID=66420 RepID=A0A194QKH4_PAPXU|nr:hypothetical protein RR46_07720 [Papilio xuthus]